MIKAIKVQVKILETDKERRAAILKAIQDVQYQERRALNKCMTFLYADTQEKLFGKELGIELPKDTERFGKSLQAYLYHICLAEMKDAGAGVVSNATNKALDQFKKDIAKGLLKGESALSTFKRGTQIFFPQKTCVELRHEHGKYQIGLSFFNREKAKELGLKNGRIFFEIIKPDGNIKSTLNRIIIGEYGLGECSFTKNHDGKYMVSIAFKMEAQTHEGENILGVDIGIHNAAALAVYDPKSEGFKRLSYKESLIQGGIIEAFRTQMQKRRWEYGVATKLANCGKGYKKRNAKLLALRDKEKNFRDTYNHKVSRYVVDTAVKHGCNLIQMEDLSGNEFSKDKFLKNWSYYDLQSKIAYKAAEHGIAVVKINPAYTSRRCSYCGNINMEIDNTSIHEWKCPVCGKNHNRDINAAMNIAIPDIENIINHQLELTAKSAG